MILRDLKEHLHIMQDRMKTQDNKGQLKQQFSVGDFVSLKLQPYCKSSVAFDDSLRLSPRYYGPFEITTNVGTSSLQFAIA